MKERETIYDFFYGEVMILNSFVADYTNHNPPLPEQMSPDDWDLEFAKYRGLAVDMGEAQ